MEQHETRSRGALSLFGSLREIGHKAEDDILTWSQGLAFHYSNFLEGLSGVEEEKKKKILHDVWNNVAEKAPKAIKEKVGLKEPIDLGKVGEILSQIMTDSNHPAVKGSGKDVNESIFIQIFFDTYHNINTYYFCFIFVRYAPTDFASSSTSFG